MKFTHQSFALIGSTNDVASEAARSGAPEGLVISAEAQSGGRGRQGRVWQSPKGNLYCSVLLRPTRAPQDWGQLAFVLALTVGHTVGHYNLPWQVKWPNDVLVHDKKISGILLESEPGWLVAGVGLNVQLTPAATQRPTTSLIAEGAGDLSVHAVLEVFLAQLAYWYGLWQAEGFAPIRAAWLEHVYGVGKPVSVSLADGQKAEGLLETLDTDGALLLRDAQGLQRRILAGDVFFV